MSLKKIATRNVATVTPESTLQEAAKKMRDEHVGDVVVVKQENGKTVPIGILTDRDIVISAVAFGISAGSVTVNEAMIPALVSAKSTDSFYHVLNLMKEHGIKRIPLVSPAGALEGIVSSEDIIGLLASELSDIVKIKDRQHRLEAERRKKFA